MVRRSVPMWAVLHDDGYFVEESVRATRAASIKEFLRFLDETDHRRWRYYRAQGWRCAKISIAEDIS